MDRRLNIGLMLSNLDNEFDSTVCRGAIIGAKEIDANLFVMPGRYIEGVYADKKRTEYEYQYNTLFSYAFPEDIDVILILIGTVGNSLSDDRKIEFLKKFGDIPVITLACEVEGYPSVCFDNKSGLRECIEHIITDHRRTRIGFVSGPPTNDDANERLGVYKDVLKSHGIPIDENRIAYGRFSPYSQQVVRELLDRCPDLEAIVFANDAMADGAYDVFRERGIEAGKDILVTGFDDAPIAASLTPPLTTAAANAAELGYSAVLECLKIADGKAPESKKVLSTMVKRRSCGCKREDAANNTYVDPLVFNRSWCRSDAQTINALTKYLFDDYRNSSRSPALKIAFSQYLKNVFEKLGSDDKGGITFTNEAKMYMISGFDEFMGGGDVMKYLDYDRLCTVVAYLSRRFLSGIDKESDRNDLAGTFNGFYQIIMRAVLNHSEKRIEDLESLTLKSNSITKDMLLFDSYDDEGYGSIIDKLMRLNIASSYLYVFPDTITHKNGQDWLPPSRVLLKSYHNGDVMEVINKEEQEISVRNLFNNRYIPDGRQKTMVLSAIFLNADHYGLFLCELEYDYFYYINSINAQLCAAMKILRLIQDKEAIRLELEETLMQIREKNMQLDAISKIDELTGVYNRRGFFAQANSVINSPVKAGKSALIIFADLDSLKLINDRFSHEDGDFAIKNAAKILCDSFRSSDIIGRIGGDEFSVLAMVDNSCGEDVQSIVRARIKKATDSFNKTHDKPYIIHMSVGVYPFVCGEDVELSKILSQADTVLYEEKKNKKSILRADLD